MNNYKKMFDEINISDDCLRKVRNMERNIAIIIYQQSLLRE